MNQVRALLVFILFISLQWLYMACATVKPADDPELALAEASIKYMWVLSCGQNGVCAKHYNMSLRNEQQEFPERTFAVHGAWACDANAFIFEEDHRGGRDASTTIPRLGTTTVKVDNVGPEVIATRFQFPEPAKWGGVPNRGYRVMMFNQHCPTPANFLIEFTVHVPPLSPPPSPAKGETGEKL